MDLAFEDIYLNTPDNEILHGWHIKPKGKSKGVIYFLHGNAENISTHIGSVLWLINEGYEIFALDYRGYGKSTGSPDIKGALVDINTGYNWLITQTQFQQKKLFIIGQSLGGALTLSFASQTPNLEDYVSGVIIDAGFDSFRGMAKEKLSDLWLTWPLQYPLSWLIPSSYDSKGHIQEIAPIPLLVIHSSNDIVIPFHHGENIFQQASEPKEFLKTNTPHTATFRFEGYRDYVLKFMAYYIKTDRHKKREQKLPF